MRILALEAYDGGSHKQFLDGLIKHSRHDFVRYGLPARKWKWRMRGAAIYFAQQIEREIDAGRICVNEIDLVFTSDMTSSADLRSLLPESFRHKPMICYFHENQLTYPLTDETERDYQYGFTNITSCLAADEVWFNSRYHRDSFLEAVQDLLGKMPDFIPGNITETIRSRSRIMPLGLPESLFEPDTAHPPPTEERTCPAAGIFSSGKRATPPTHQRYPPTVLWNHRWEYDKNPDEFFEVLFDLERAGVDFRLMVAGENFRTAPPIFAAAGQRLADKIDHFGYVAERSEYAALLGRADIVVSTARHEFYGLSVLEAIAARCYPLLPNRLSYPELIPVAVQSQILYHSQDELRDRLKQILETEVPPLPQELNQFVGTLAWDKLISTYDDAFEVEKQQREK